MDVVSFQIDNRDSSNVLPVACTLVTVPVWYFRLGRKISVFRIRKHLCGGDTENNSVSVLLLKT